LRARRDLASSVALLVERSIMQTNSLRIVAVALLVSGGMWASACGGSDTTSSPPASGGSAGTGGSGGSAGSATSGSAGTGGSLDVTCGSMQCKHAGLGTFTLPACCPTGTTDTCGLDGSILGMYGPTFADPCQPLHQPGADDMNCPDKSVMASGGLSIPLKGCCRADTGTCGYDLDNPGMLLPLGLGCVDSTPFLDGGTPLTCGDGGGGAAGATN
jgi:hypothetical protein